MDGVLQRRFHWLVALWLLQCFAYFTPAATWNPVSRFALTHALVERGGVAIDPLASATGDRAHRNGHWYTDKAPLPSLMAVPGYAAVRGLHVLLDRPAPAYEVRAGGTVPAARLAPSHTFQRLLHVSSVTTSGLAGVALALLLLRWLGRRYGPRCALVATGATMLATPLFPYASSMFGHVPAAAFLLGAVVALDRHGRTPRGLRWAGACTAAAAGCEYLTAVPGLFLLAWGVADRDVRMAVRRTGQVVIGAAAPSVIVAGYLWVAFGKPWRTGYAHVTDPTFVQGHAQGLMGIGWPDPEALVGLLVGPSRGLLYLAPVAALGLLGLAKVLRREDAGPTRAFALGALALLLVNSGYYMWWGGAATGPRHLVPVLPLLALGLAEWWQQPRLRWVFVPVALWSAATMLTFTAVGLEAPEHRETLFGYAWHHAAHGRFAALRGASNLGIMIGLPAAASLGPLLVWWLLGGRALWRLAGALDGDEAPD